MPYEIDARFPPDVPIKEIRAIIDIVRNGTQEQYRETLGRSGWYVAGYGMSHFLQDSAVLGVAPQDCDDDTCCAINDLATTLGVSVNVATVCDSPLTAATAFNPQLWAEIVRLIMELIRSSWS